MKSPFEFDEDKIIQEEIIIDSNYKDIVYTYEMPDCEDLVIRALDLWQEDCPIETLKFRFEKAVSRLTAHDKMLWLKAAREVGR